MREVILNKEKITHISRNPDLYWHLIMFLAIGVGIYVRFKGIGRWPLADDEYYIAKSVNNILTYGIPKFECGGYYVRGLLYQYLAAPFLYFFSNDEFYLRIIPAIFNVLAIPAMYYLGKRLSGRAGACIAVIFFSFSLWEIEFSRFARMYIPFQTIFIWYVLFLLKILIDQDKKYEKWMHSLSILSVFVYEAGFFLLVLNFIPLYFSSESRKKASVFIKIILLLFGYLFLSTNFRYLGVEYYLPREILALYVHKDGIALTKFLVTTLRFKLGLILFLIIPICAFIFAVINLIKSCSFNLFAKISLCVVLMISLLDLFGLVIISSTVLIVLNIIEWKSSTKKILKQCLLVILIAFSFWGIYYFKTIGLHQSLKIPDPNFWKEIIFALFNYPDAFRKIVGPWMRTMPFLALSSFFIIFLSNINLLNKPFEHNTENRILLSLLLICFVFVSAAPLAYHETRYTFFLYPIVILLLVDSIIRLIRYASVGTLKSTILLILFSIIFCIFAEDFGINHIINIDSKEVNFRLLYNRSISRHYYDRMDYKTPGLMINQEMYERDIVISLFTPVDYYLKKIDYIYISPQSWRLPSVVACSGKKELWSNAKLIYLEKDLWNIVDNSQSTVWIISQSTKASKKNYEISKKIEKKYNSFRYNTSIDGKINVYRIRGNMFKK